MTLEQETNMDDLDNNEDYGDDGDGDESSDDDSSLLVHVPLLQSSAEVASKILDKPPEGFEWNDNAIVECFELAVKSHDNKNNNDDNYNTGNGGNRTNLEWYPPPTRNSGDLVGVSSWQPKRLPLPTWAKDPFPELITEKQSKSIS